LQNVLAGFIVGYAISLVVAPSLAFAALRRNRASTLAHAIAPPGTNVVALSILMQFGAMLIFTAIGIILGLALDGLQARRPDGGLGSPNLIYTIIVLALTVAAMIPALLVPSARRYALPGAVALAVAYGWFMPWLAKLA
jgi:hypothetical protein